MTLSTAGVLSASSFASLASKASKSTADVSVLPVGCKISFWCDGAVTFLTGSFAGSAGSFESVCSVVGDSSVGAGSGAGASGVSGLSVVTSSGVVT